ncbi:tetraspanin-11 [Bacillus rossius redtenbacheri]|uniref:tetraspanin-11 n=1 Tax=Bacillus rossius redtenbacheri TaxID=93214 RepID=UPI002FDCF94F
MMSLNLSSQVSGAALVVLGGCLMTDAPRVLLSRLLTRTQAAPHPLFHHVALGLVALGVLVSAGGVLGWWAACLRGRCVLAAYLFLLVLLLLGECSCSVVATLCPQYVGVGVDAASLTESVQRLYGVPGKDQFTAAVDLAQTTLQCCGAGGAADYDTSVWRLRELGRRDLAVPRSCCRLANPAGDERAFLDPRPLEPALCQSRDPANHTLARHSEGCAGKLDVWFRDHVNLFLAVLSGVVVVQLAALLSAVLACKRPSRHQRGAWPGAGPLGVVVIAKSASVGRSGAHAVERSPPGAEPREKRRCIYEKDPWSERSVLRMLDAPGPLGPWKNPQSGAGSLESDSIMW